MSGRASTAFVATARMWTDWLMATTRRRASLRRGSSSHLPGQISEGDVHHTDPVPQPPGRPTAPPTADTPISAQHRPSCLGRRQRRPCSLADQLPLFLRHGRVDPHHQVVCARHVSRSNRIAVLQQLRERVSPTSDPIQAGCGQHGPELPASKQCSLEPRSSIILAAGNQQITCAEQGASPPRFTVRWISGGYRGSEVLSASPSGIAASEDRFRP